MYHSLRCRQSSDQNSTKRKASGIVRTSRLPRTLVSILVLIGSGLWVAALLIMAQTVQQSAHFSDLHPFIVGVNVAGLLVQGAGLGAQLFEVVHLVRPVGWAQRGWRWTST